MLLEWLISQRADAAYFTALTCAGILVTMIACITICCLFMYGTYHSLSCQDEGSTTQQCGVDEGPAQCSARHILRFQN